jgi:hypothetical protein
MPSDPLPPPVHDLLRDALTSFEHLEVLLLLQAHSHEDWSVRSVSERTNLPPELAERVLLDLESKELIRRPTRNRAAFRFGPRLPAVMDTVTALAALYREQRAAVMSAMNLHAIERIRSGTMRAFADSFIVGKKRDEDG